MQAEELLTSEEAATILGTTRPRVYAMIRAGKLRAFLEPTKGSLLPHRYRLLKSEVEKLAREGWRQRRLKSTRPRSRTADERRNET